jgi:hypothetical protein
LQLSIKAAGRRSRGCARHSLAEIPASYLAHWFRSPEAGFEFFSRAREGAGETRRVAAPSRPVPKNSGRRGGAFLIFPCGKGITRRNFGFSRPGAGKRNRGKFGPNMVPLRRNSERIYCIGNRGRFTRRKREAGLNLSLFYSVVYEGFRAAAASFVPEQGTAGKQAFTASAFARFFEPIRVAIASARMRARRSNAHGHYDIAVARGFIARRAELAGGLFVF